MRLYKPLGIDFIWSRLFEGDVRSRTAYAVSMVEQGAVTNALQAARLAQVSSSAVYRELKRRDKRGVCPCCGRLLPVDHKEKS